MRPAKQANQTEHDLSVRGVTRARSIDPVCGMTVNPKSAAGTYEYNGQSYYFCSTHCLNKFREDPEQFLKKSTETTSPPVVIQRETKSAAKPVAQTYTCPMHPEVRQDEP